LGFSVEFKIFFFSCSGYAAPNSVSNKTELFYSEESSKNYSLPETYFFKASENP
jgi:hypothetical protein